MPSFLATERQFDLATWAIPVVADRISEFYAGLDWQGVTVEPVQLKRRHIRMWSCLLEGMDAEARVCRRDLRLLTLKSPKAAAIFDHIDRAVVDELLDMIIGRFGRSRDAAHGYGMTLMAAAASLAEARAAV